MKIEFLQSFSGSDFGYQAKEKAEFEDEEALRLIDAEIAIPCTKKAYDNALKKVKAKEEEEAEKQQKMEAIMYEDELKAEKEKLLARVNEINITLDITAVDERYNIVADDELVFEDLVIIAKELNIEFDEDAIEREALIDLIQKVKEPGKE